MAGRAGERGRRARGDHRHPVGYRRGAGAGRAFGPEGVRRALLAALPGLRGARARARASSTSATYSRCRSCSRTRCSARNSAGERARRCTDRRRRPTSSLPVAPLSIAERAVSELLARNPRARHLHARRRSFGRVAGRRGAGAPRLRPWAIVHVDAHTDLLPERLGVRLCFATWAYHANELLGRGGRLVQVGVRASSRSKQHWESTLGVRQFWADEVRARGDGVIDDVIAHLRGLGVARVYLERHRRDRQRGGAVTGAPEANGLLPRSWSR